MMEKVRRADALTVNEFNARLVEFGRDAGPDDTVGDGKTYGGNAWIWVRRLGRWYHLNADSTGDGVAGYLGLWFQHGDSLQWTIVANERGKKNKVAFGPELREIPGFYLYREDD